MNEPIGSVQPVVLLKSLSKSYRLGGQEIPVLDRIDARIDAGECVALMGPSGSGKSTLMNIIGCLDRPTSGDYLFCGREVGRLDDDELSRIRKESDRVRVPELQSSAEIDRGGKRRVAARLCRCIETRAS